MKKFILSVLLLVLLFVAGMGYFLFKTLNAQSYQQQIISSISEITGRKVTVSGTSSFKWLPMPTFVMTGVALSNQSASDRPNMITADSLQIQIEWASLFKMPLVVKSVELIRPTLHLERLENNRSNWDFSFFAPSQEHINDLQFLDATASTNSTQIDNLHITGGTITYENKITNQQATIQNINGDIVISSLQGPYTFDGTAHIGKNIFSGSVRSESLQPDMPTKITAQIAEENSGLSLEFTGQFFPYDPKKILQGDASFSIQQPDIFTQSIDFPVLNDTIKKSAVGSFAIDFTPTQSTLDNLILRFGEQEHPFALTTTVKYVYKTPQQPAQYTGEFAANELNLNDFIPYIRQFDWNQLSKTADQSVASFKINIPTIKWNDTTLTDTAFTTQWQNGTITVTDGKMTLPHMPIQFNAVAAQDSNIPFVKAHITGNTKQPKEILSLLPINQEQWGTVLNKIKTIGSDIELSWTPDVFNVSLKNLSIDATTITGSIKSEQVGNKVLSLDLSINNLNTDTYTGWQPQKEKQDLSTLPQIVRQAITKPLSFGNRNIDIKTKFDSLTWHQLPITKGVLSANMANGVLTVDNLELSGVATSQLKTSSKITGIGTPSAAIESLSFNFKADQLPLLLGRSPFTSPWPLLTEASEASASGTLTNSDNLWKVNLSAQVNDAQIRTQGSILLNQEEPRFDALSFNITHPNFHQLLSLVNLKKTGVSNLSGALRAQGILSGTPSQLTIEQADASIGLQKITGSLSYDLGTTKKIVATLNSPALEGERFMPKQSLFKDETGKLSNKPFDFSSLTDWDISLQMNVGRLTYKMFDLGNVVLNLTAKDKVITLHEFSGLQQNNAKAPVQIKGSLSYIADPTIKGNFEFSDLIIRPDFMIIDKLSYGGGHLDINGQINATGLSASDMINNLNGSGSVLFDKGQFIGAETAQIQPLIEKALKDNISQIDFDTQMKRIMHMGKTSVDSLSGDFSIARGVVRFMDMTLKTPTATATPTQITWSIPQSSVDITIPLTQNELKQYPPVIMNMTLNSRIQKYTPDYADLSKTITGMVNQEIAQQKTAQEQETQRMVQQQRQEKSEKVRMAILQANQTVRNLMPSLKSISDETVQTLIQNAMDALNTVNTTAAKEQRTTEQEDLILEYARLAELKIIEAKNAADQIKPKSTDIVANYKSKATDMIQHMENILEQAPYIAVLPKLIDQSRQNLNIIQSVQQRLETTPTNAEDVLQEATTAYQAIETAYTNAIRFDGISDYANQNASKKSVRGTIERVKK